MKLTIAMRVIGGFAITSFLLLVLGFNSINVISGIADSTQQVNKVSIPALDASSKLQQKFVEMSKTTLNDYYATQYEQLDMAYQSFNQQSNEFEQDLQRLKTVLADDPELLNMLPEVEDIYQRFHSSAQEMFDSKKQTLTLADKVSTQYEELEYAADDASTYALDFIDLNDLASVNPGARDLLNSIETNLVSLVTGAADIRKESKASTIEIISKEMKYVEDSLVENTKKFKSIGGLSSLDGYGDITDQLDVAIELITSNNSIVKTKLDWASQVNRTDILLSQTNEDIVSGLRSLSNLAESVNEQLDVTRQEVQKSVNSGISQSWVVIAIALVLSVAIAYNTVINVTKPLAEVNRVLNIASTGDLTSRLDDSSKDEFGTLAKNCNTLIDSLRELINGIVHRSNQLATASEETSMVVKESTIAINDQRSQIEQAATATTEMSSTSQSVMERANEALDDIKHADEEAERVKQISNVNRDTIMKLANEIDQASGVIDEVNQHSAAIGGILDVIRGVAEQTNLLALNAAIEAARAGEQGRGFAVVADEVRSLASKTQQSTEEIQSMIEQLQKGSKSAVTVMNNSKSQADLCVSQTEKASEALEAITDSVHQANDMSEQIVNAAREQNQVSSEISERLESIVAIAEQTASGSQQTEISSQEVAKLAEELRNSVDQFKL